LGPIEKLDAHGRGVPDHAAALWHEITRFFLGDLNGQAAALGQGFKAAANARAFQRLSFERYTMVRFLPL